jgi:hypothetical protein
MKSKPIYGLIKKYTLYRLVSFLNLLMRKADKIIRPVDVIVILVCHVYSLVRRKQLNTLIIVLLHCSNTDAGTLYSNNMFHLHEYVTLKTNSTYLPAHLPASLPACLSACLPAHLPACLSAYLPACLPACQPACLPAWVTRLRENATMDPTMQSCGNAPRIMQKRQAS